MHSRVLGVTKSRSHVVPQIDFAIPQAGDVLNVVSTEVGGYRAKSPQNARELTVQNRKKDQKKNTKPNTKTNK